jgi:hypothetical protein
VQSFIPQFRNSKHYYENHAVSRPRIIALSFWPPAISAAF